VREIDGHPIVILLVEDNVGDVRLTQEAFKEGKVSNLLLVAPDGIEAMALLRQQGSYSDAPRPDLILLDLNIPRMDGREVLVAIKSDPHLKRIPVVVLTTSKAEEDIVRTYDLNANCYITKPVDFDKFLTVVKSIDEFWLTIAKLPTS
jgi:two-component system, chemotaxis family, response regulator Rcp1